MPPREVAVRIARETGGFTGGGIDLFGDAGKFSLWSLKRNGLKRDSRVLDLGCGALRLGYRLVPFLDPDCYYGIEPNRLYVEAGLKHAIGPELAAEKRPKFHHAADFDFSAFGVKFDFVVARSIFSHTSPETFCHAMESFRDNSTDTAIMLASFRPILKRDGAAEFIDSNPEGHDWRLRRYAVSFLQRRAEERGLFADKFGKSFNGQVWLRVSRQP